MSHRISEVNQIALALWTRSGAARLHRRGPGGWGLPCDPDYDATGSREQQVPRVVVVVVKKSCQVCCVAMYSPLKVLADLSGSVRFR